MDIDVENVFFFSVLQIYKDSQFNSTKIINSKIQVQDRTQTHKHK